jgi:hypothetical protein
MFVFDEFHHFYMCPTTDVPPAFFVDPLSFLFFSDAPATSLPLPRPTLPTSVSFVESSPVVPDYTVKPLVIQVYSRCGTRLSEVRTSLAELSFDVSSSYLEVSSSPHVASSSPIGSSPEQLLERDQCIRRPPNCYSPSAFTATALSKPASYHDDILHPECQHAMAEDIATLERTGTWDLVTCPPLVRLITYKWVYKVKTRSDGSLERYKARLVARGFQQEHGRDYDKTFAPVAHMTTIHTLLIVASVWG